MNPFSSHTESLKSRISKVKSTDSKEIESPTHRQLKVGGGKKKEEPIVTYNISLNKMEPPPSEKYICIYRINSGDRPFIEYLLMKDGDTVSFPISDDADKMAETIVGKHLNSQGYIKFNNKILVFYSIKYNKVEQEEKEYIWCLLDEICNRKKVLNYSIDPFVTTFFIQNPKFIYLFKGDGVLETPNVGHTGHDIKEDMIIHLGAFNQMGDFGHFFYFNDYDNVASSAFIVRYALFLGETKVLLNRSNDTKMGPNPLTARLYDKMGTWTREADSLYVGNITLSDGTKYPKSNTTVLKDFNQHLVLSCHGG